MTKHEETIDAHNLVCPYCGHSYQVEAEDYSETSHIEKCCECGKKYYARSEFSVDHYAKPDCELNKEKHLWVPIHDGSSYNFCSVCGKCKVST